MTAPKADSGAPPAPADFIRDIVAAHVAEKRYPRIHTRFPPGTQRLPAHRARQVHLPEFRHRARIRRHLQPAHGRHQSDQGGCGVCGFHPARMSNGSSSGWADDRLGFKPKGKTPEAVASAGRGRIFIWGRSAPSAAPAGAVLRLRLFRADLRICRHADSQRAWPTSAILSPEDTDNYRGAPDRPGKEQPFRARVHGGEPRSVHRMRGGRVSRRRAHVAGEN